MRQTAEDRHLIAKGFERLEALVEFEVPSLALRKPVPSRVLVIVRRQADAVGKVDRSESARLGLRLRGCLHPRQQGQGERYARASQEGSAVQVPGLFHR